MAQFAGKGWALDIPKNRTSRLAEGADLRRFHFHGLPEILHPGDAETTTSTYSTAATLSAVRCRKPALTEMAGRYKFDAVVFNNGLHSLHWTPDQVTDEVVHRRMSDLAQCFKKGASDAKIYYLMTTPHTAPRPEKDKPVESLGEKKRRGRSAETPSPPRS